jgi:hypothetical protein
MKIFRILMLFILLPSIYSYSQDWPKIYGGNTNNWCWDLKESYDKGYIIDVQVDPGTSVPQMYAWIIKTDINGIQLWTKTVSSNLYQVAFNGPDMTSDGGFVVTGVTTKLDPENYDVIFVKFNACGEKEWCKIISTPGNDDYGVKIKEIPGGYISLVSYFQDWKTKRIWLFKLNTEGNILWEQLINQSDNYISNSEGRDLLVLQDNNYLVTGDAYDGSPGHVYYLRPLIIKTDSNANVLWSLPFGHTNGFRGDLATFPQVNETGFYYMAARHFRYSSPYGDSPCFLKVSPTGEEVFYKDLLPNSNLGKSNTLNIKNNDSLFISADWYDENDSVRVGIFKSDTLGNITKTRIIFKNVFQQLESSLFTYDEKYLTVGDFNPDSTTFKIYLYKFTSNLEYTPLNTQPRIYDSLCPHSIVSDTASLDDCAVITDVYDPVKTPERFNLLVYPNPAKDKLTIDLPQFLLRKTSSGTVQINTIYHHWNSSFLEIFDINGKLMYSREIPNHNEKVELDVSSWQEGMYVARVVFMNEVVAKATFIIRD